MLQRLFEYWDTFPPVNETVAVVFSSKGKLKKQSPTAKQPRRVKPVEKPAEQMTFAELQDMERGFNG
jgi:hypothetical protein